jgi:hypothetical protein
LRVNLLPLWRRIKKARIAWQFSLFKFRALNDFKSMTHDLPLEEEFQSTGKTILSKWIKGE